MGFSLSPKLGLSLAYVEAPDLLLQEFKRDNLGLRNRIVQFSIYQLFKIAVLLFGKTLTARRRDILSKYLVDS